MSVGPDSFVEMGDGAAQTENVLELPDEFSISFYFTQNPFSANSRMEEFKFMRDDLSAKDLITVHPNRWAYSKLSGSWDKQLFYTNRMDSHGGGGTGVVITGGKGCLWVHHMYGARFQPIGWCPGRSFSFGMNITRLFSSWKDISGFTVLHLLVSPEEAWARAEEAMSKTAHAGAPSDTALFAAPTCNTKSAIVVNSRAIGVLVQLDFGNGHYLRGTTDGTEPNCARFPLDKDGSRWWNSYVTYFRLKGIGRFRVRTIRCHDTMKSTEFDKTFNIECELRSVMLLC
jgi:hypothetical protein